MRRARNGARRGEIGREGRRLPCIQPQQHRTRRRRVHHSLQSRQVIRITNVLRKFQHSGEHRRYELAMGHPVALDGIQAAFGIELLQDNRRDAAGLHGHRPDRRRGVIQRCRAEIDRIRVHPEADQRPQQAQSQRGQPRSNAAHMPEGIVGCQRTSDGPGHKT